MGYNHAKAECFVGSFELLGADFVTVRSKTAVIDTTALTINVEVLFGTDLKNVYPQFSLATDCKLDPKIVGRVIYLIYQTQKLTRLSQETGLSGNLTSSSLNFNNSNS
jgi:hypothetical protein